MTNVIPILAPYIESYSVSKPIFRLTLSPSGTRICSDLDPEAKFVPHVDHSDPISVLVNSCIQETFLVQNRRFELNADGVSNDVMQRIRSVFCNFLKKNLPNKEPTQTKIYRWYARNFPKFGYQSYEYSSQTASILLFKYLRQNTNDEFKVLEHRSEHRDNIIALLEAFKEKYGQ